MGFHLTSLSRELGSFHPAGVRFLYFGCFLHGFSLRVPSYQQRHGAFGSAELAVSCRSGPPRRHQLSGKFEFPGRGWCTRKLLAQITFFLYILYRAVVRSRQICAITGPLQLCLVAAGSTGPTCMAEFNPYHSPNAIRGGNPYSY